MFIAGVFINAKKKGAMDKLWYIQTMEYYLVLKKDAIKS